MTQKVEATAVLAMSPQQLAAALNINVAHIYDALAKRELIARHKSSYRRILICDAIEWVKSWPECDTYERD
jgi:hypothetical protein